MPIDYDVDDFFNDDVAVDATYTNQAGQPSAVRVILDRPYSEASQFGDVGFEGRQIWITVKTSDFEDCTQGETVTIGTETFYITNPQFDLGISKIMLSLDDPNES